MNNFAYDDIFDLDLSSEGAITGNVLDNDSYFIAQASKVNGTEIANDGTTVSGLFGTLEVSPDGSYTYTLTISGVEARLLDYGEDGYVSDTFTYELFDILADERETANIDIRLHAPTFNVIQSADGEVDGTGDADHIIGLSGTGQVLAGKGGSDWIVGGAGNDTIWGDVGDDTIFGGAGDDRIDLGNGDRNVDGGTGEDTGFGLGFDDVGTFDAEAMNLEYLEVTGSFEASYTDGTAGTGSATFNGDWTYVKLTEVLGDTTYVYTFVEGNTVLSKEEFTETTSKLTMYDYDNSFDWSETIHFADGDNSSITFIYDDGIEQTSYFLEGALAAIEYSDTLDVEDWDAREIESDGNARMETPHFDIGTFERLWYLDDVLTRRCLEDRGGLFEWDTLDTYYSGDVELSYVVYDNGDEEEYQITGGVADFDLYTDHSDTRTWHSRRRDYDDEGDLEQTTTVHDDGTTIQIRYHDTGAVASETTTEADGDVTAVFYADDETLLQVLRTDESDSENWLFSDTRYDANGGVDRTIITWDNGMEVESLYKNGVVVSKSLTDVRDVQPWRTAERLFNANGIMKYEVTFDDNGDKLSALRIDRDDLFGWREIGKIFDATGGVTSKRILWDGGNEQFEFYEDGRLVERVTEDHADKYGWSLRFQEYDENGDLSFLLLDWDGGNQTAFSYEAGALAKKVTTDVNDSHNWDTKTVTFDLESGEETGTYYVLDPDPLLV